MNTHMTSQTGSYEYTVNTGNKTGSLAGPQTGVYEEMIYRNFTGEPICIIDDTGDCQEIPTVTDSYNRFNQRCTIQRRGCVGPQIDPTGTIHDQYRVPMNLRTWVIPIESLHNGPVYVQELNILICFKRHADDAVHPFKRTSLQESQNALCEYLRENIDEQKSCIILANDPLKRFNHLFGMISDVPIDIQVTDLIDAANQKAMLTVIINTGKGFTRRSFDIEEVLKDGFMTLANCPVGVIGLSESIVNLHKNEQLYTKKDLETEIARATAIKERTSQQEIETLKVEKASLKAELSETKQKLNSLQNQYDSVTGSIKGQQDISANYAAQAKNNAIASETALKKIQIVSTIVASVVSLASIIATIVSVTSGGDDSSSK